MAYDSEHGKLWQDIKADLDKTRARASKFAHDAEWAFGKRTARVLGVVMLFAVVVVLLLVFLDWYIAPTNPEQKQALVVTLAQILGGTALLSGIYFTWRTLQVNREGQITERFTRAIDQLGATYDDKSKNLELRLGGIYALERIAKESEEDHWSIMEVLTAYVRRHAPWRPEEAQQVEQDAAAEKKSEEDSAGSKGKSEPTDVHAPEPDIQAIITVLRRRSLSFDLGEPERLDLTATNLTEANLAEANLSYAKLSYAKLTGADLSRANLPGANLSKADLSPVPVLLRTMLGEVTMGVGANLSGANLSGANLSEADLSRVTLSGTDLSGTDLTGADLTGADLSEAILSGAYLSGADLSGTDLTGADLSRANLPGANLDDADLTQEQLEKTMSGDEDTRLPPDLKPPAHWNAKTDEQIEGD